MSEPLIQLARRDYGCLVERIVVWPRGLGIDVHLIGGDVVQYFPSGRRYHVNQPTVLVKTRRRVAALRGITRTILGKV